MMPANNPGKSDQNPPAPWLRWLWQFREQLPRSLTRRLYKAMSRRGDVPADTFRCRFFDLDYHGRFDNNIDSAIYFYGAFEKPLLNFMSDTLQSIAPENGVFVDIGANVGQHSLALSRSAARVIAFEPWHVVRERLSYHIELNQLKNIEVIDAGLSDHNGSQVFFAPAGVNAGIGSFDPDSQHKGNQPAGELRLIRGDDYFAEHPPAQIHLIKMDVEGFEKPALKGLENTLKQYRPVLVCELSYGQRLSFTSIEELRSCLPQNYELFCLNKRRADGSKRQRQNARARSTGEYSLIPYLGLLPGGQDDVIACPLEYLNSLPMAKRGQ